MTIYHRIVLESVIGMFASLILIMYRGVNAGMFPMMAFFTALWWASWKLGWID